MPSFATFLAHPEKRRPSPPPPRADLRTVFQLGMTLWAVALVVNLVLLLTGAGDVRVLATCGAGIGLGGLGLLWARRHPEEFPPEEPAAEAAPAAGEGPAERGADAAADAFGGVAEDRTEDRTEDQGESARARKAEDPPRS
ncbi:DUF2530 domain-containing protein [Antribacter sp. KLBMP9083]|uniref:DUF2530 domain-containing protein n=1 Tax=Antribacter soli TaxID=2910976 RepID=A0AA41QEY6_9MICO|nr:DUF2530 domain-containing protein [Antribacter soli]MCF4122224.1 DUF2530 domain-containing protein [Antribacter soli]